MEIYVFISQGLFALVMAIGGAYIKRLWDELDSYKTESNKVQDNLRTELRQEMESFRLQIKHTSDRVGNLNLTLVKDYPTKADLREDLHRLERKVDDIGSKMEKGLERIFTEFFGPKSPGREE